MNDYIVSQLNVEVLSDSFALLSLDVMHLNYIWTHFGILIDHITISLAFVWYRWSISKLRCEYLILPVLEHSAILCEKTRIRILASDCLD